MLEELIAIQNEVMDAITMDRKRYLYDQINWETQGLCLFGDRGVGKTTMLCQRLLLEYKSVKRALYISADHIHVIANGLFAIAKEYFSYGGEALFIDEVHKYPNWSVEIKNILDTYKKKRVVFSASSSLDLHKSKGDLSRRVVYHKLFGLSFREYLEMLGHSVGPARSLEDLLKHHVEAAEQLRGMTVLQLFQDYLSHGYYPFFLEGLDDFLSKLTNVIEKVIFEDIAVVFNLKQTTLPILKKLLWLVAMSPGLQPNIDRISSSLSVSREVVYNCLEYLAQSGLIQNLYPLSSGLKMIRKPGKIFFANTNLLYVINGALKKTNDSGAIRETFFANQLSLKEQVHLPEKGDFLINEQYLFEVGGPNKSFTQIRGIENGYLAVDGIESGFGNKIPLYLFGFLY